ncbi:MAG TPA: hypothetical protein VGQ72_03700 [Pyrinomonadaceae bacterium]|nr:hypothetical protein [Pyrinomonadaceae bacterium]
MTQMRRTYLVSAIALLVCFGLAHGQETKPNSENRSSTDERLREKAFDLLESLADQIGTLQSAENRARLGSNIAASLWSHDEKRARSLLVSVRNDINTVLQNTADGQSESQTRVVFLQLRVDTVERIARYDADLALEFLKATEPSSDVSLPYNLAETERGLEMRLAKQLINESPEMALKLARKMLARGFSYDLATLLRQMNRKQKEQALILYKEIVAKLSDADIPRDSTAYYFALDLVHSFKPPAADEQTFRELIGVFIARALAAGCANKTSVEDENGWFCEQVGRLLPKIAKVDPSAAAKLKHWAQEEVDSQPGWSPEAYEELNEVVESGTLDDVLALAAKYPEMKNVINERAMEKALMAGDLERARKIAEGLDDSETRQYLLAQIDRAQKLAAINDEKLAEVQQTLNTIPGAEQRLRYLMAMANQIGANDQKAALKLLDQANQIVDNLKPGKQQTEAQVGLAMMYCLEKSERGLAIMESLMPKLNDLVTAAVKLDDYENHYLRDGEWNMSNEGTVGQLLTTMAQNAGYFAWCDFDRALSAAAQFERPELRMMAQLKLAQAVLAGPPKRLQVADPLMRYGYTQ